MKKESLESADFEILKLLPEKGLSSNEIWHEIEGNRNKALERVNRLITRKFLHIENRRKWLTEKGKLALLQNDVDGLGKILDRIHVLTLGLASKPDMLRTWAAKGRKAVHDAAQAALKGYRQDKQLKKESQDMTLERRATRIREAYFDPFRRALRDMQRMSPYLASPKIRDSLLGQELFVHVTEKLAIEAVLEDELDLGPDGKLRKPDIIPEIF